jgi:hypothetical protein
MLKCVFLFIFFIVLRPSLLIAQGGNIGKDTVCVDSELANYLRLLKMKDIDTVLIYQYLATGDVEYSNCILSSKKGKILDCIVFWKEKGTTKGVKIDCENQQEMKNVTGIFTHSHCAMFKKKWVKKTKFYPPTITDQPFWDISYYEKDKKYGFILNLYQVEGNGANVWQKEVPILKDYWEFIQFIQTKTAH